MRQRITVKHLEAAINRLNTITGNPAEPLECDAEGKLIAAVGNYHLSRAYGGYALHQYVTEGGAVREPLYTGHIPARELYDRIHAYTLGYAEACNRRLFGPDGEAR